MLNKEIFEIETGKLLVKYEKMGWGWEGITFSVVAVICFLFFAFVFVVAVAAVAIVCLFVFPCWFLFLASLFWYFYEVIM